MNRISRRVLLPVLVLAIVLLSTFATAAVVVRNYIASLFVTSQNLALDRQLADRALKLQLDEETGVRGFVSTRDPEFLQPYLAAKGQLDATFAHLHSALADHETKAAYASVDDAWLASGIWKQRVADVLLAHPRGNVLRVERDGKILIDRIRGDIRTVDHTLFELQKRHASDVSDAVDHLNIFVIAVAGTFVVLVVLYGLQLVSVVERIAAKDRAASSEAREKAELFAAFETEKRIADTLQDAFTHRPLPILEPLAFSASYVPASENTKVGGDWYDVIALSDRRVLFAIGDVTGHGIEAAVTMNNARQSLISSALLDCDPGAILARTNADILSNETRLVTAIAGVADAGTFEFTYAVAGHPPPILLEPGRAPELLECGSLPLGAIAGTTYAVRRVRSVPGASLVLYTDGAVEHSKDVIEGERLLLDAIAAARELDVTDVAAYLHRTIFHDRAVGDDVAILTIRFATGVAGDLALAPAGDLEIGHAAG